MERALARGVSSTDLRRMRRIAGLAARHGRRVWLVGGPVRDLLLGKTINDIDLAIDGCVEAIGRAVAAEFDASFRGHARFSTAVVTFDDGHVDLAATRTESYDSPGALPRVRPGTIDEDLARRDFSVNAMAMHITASGNGPLIDPCDGRSDLRDRLLRTLHDRSFHDDPTRMFRAARFAVRFGFRLEGSTLGALKESATGGHACGLSGERVAAELRHSVNEHRPSAVLRLLDRWGLGASWGAAGSPTAAGRERLRHAESRLRCFRRTAREETALRLACAFHDLSPSRRERIAERLRLMRIERRILVPGPRRAGEILQRLGRTSGRADLDRLFRSVDVPTLILAGMLADARGFARLRRWWQT